MSITIYLLLPFYNAGCNSNLISIITFLHIETWRGQSLCGRLCSFCSSISHFPNPSNRATNCNLSTASRWPKNLTWTRKSPKKATAQKATKFSITIPSTLTETETLSKKKKSMRETMWGNTPNITIQNLSLWSAKILLPVITLLINIRPRLFRPTKFKVRFQKFLDLQEFLEGLWKARKQKWREESTQLLTLIFASSKRTCVSKVLFKI